MNTILAFFRLPTRLAVLLGAFGLLLPQAVHAQAPFQLPRGGIAVFANSGQAVAALAPFDNVVEVTPTYALLADGRLIRLADGTVALTGIVSILETKYGYFFAVHADGRLFIPVGSDLVASNDVRDALSVEAADPGFVESLLCFVFRAGGKVTRYLADQTVREFAISNQAPFSARPAPKGSHLAAQPAGPSTPVTDYKVVDSVLQITNPSGAQRLVNQVLSIWDAKEPGLGQSPVAIMMKAAVVVTQDGVRKTSKGPSAGAASEVFFGHVPVSSQSNPRTLRITNEGRGTLTFGLTVDGPAAADFSGFAGVGGSLAPGEREVLFLYFTPSAEGRRAAVLHIASNDVERSSFDLDLTGQGSTTNNPPIVPSDHAYAPAGGTATLTRLLQNDYDYDGDPLRIVAVAPIPGRTEGTVTLDPATGFVTYRSAPNAGTTDTFSYMVSDETSTTTGFVTVTLVDPVRLAAGKIFRGEDAGDSATVTFGMLTPRFAAARALRRTNPALAAASTLKLTATVSERLDGQSYRGRVTFNAVENSGQAVLAGPIHGELVAFETTVDEDGNVLLIANGLKLRRDTFDRRHPASGELVGNYTMSLPGMALDPALFPGYAVGDSVASVTVAPAGTILIRGRMADGRPFIGSAALAEGYVASFSIPLAYPGTPGGRFSGELSFDRTNAAGSLAGTATWEKPRGDRAVNLVGGGFRATGRLVGSFYKPADLPASPRVRFTFGLDTAYIDFLATASGALATRLVLSGETTPVPFQAPPVDPISPIIPIFPAFTSESFNLVGSFSRSTGLLLARRLANQFHGPRSVTGVVLQEQAQLTGSAIFQEGTPGEFSLFPQGYYTTPVMGVFVP